MKFLLILLFPIMSFAQVRVAVIDSGNTTNVPICGSADLTGEGPYDYLGHGSNVSGLIHDGAKDVEYCQFPIKVFGKTKNTSIAYGLLLALVANVKIINISAGGVERNEAECSMVKQLLDMGVYHPRS